MVYQGDFWGHCNKHAYITHVYVNKEETTILFIEQVWKTRNKFIQKKLNTNTKYIKKKIIQTISQQFSFFIS